MPPLLGLVVITILDSIAGAMGYSYGAPAALFDDLPKSRGSTVVSRKNPYSN
jgi:hypothetical protein